MFLVTDLVELPSLLGTEVKSLKTLIAPGLALLGDVEVVPPGVALPAEELRAVVHLVGVAGHGVVVVEGDLLG